MRNGNLYIERDQATITTYEVQNGDQEDVKLLIKHPRSSESELYQPPKGTEDNVAEGAAYVDLDGPLLLERDRAGASHDRAQGILRPSPSVWGAP